MGKLKYDWFYLLLITIQLTVINFTTGETLHNLAWFTIGMFTVMIFAKPNWK